MYDNQVIVEKCQEGIRNAIYSEELSNLFEWSVNFLLQEWWKNKLNEFLFYIIILLSLCLCFYLIVKIRNFIYDHILNY